MQSQNNQKQKQLNISITKIFNWPQSQPSCLFDLNFYPQQSDDPIIEKSVVGVYMANCMNLNSALKITYTSDQTTIILQLIKNKNNNKDVLGQFLIDLEILKEKNVQYFPFGTDYVLQINVYVPVKPNSRSSRAVEQYSSNNLTRNTRMYTDTRPTGQRRTPDKQQRIQKYDRYDVQRKRIPSRVMYNQRRYMYGDVGQPTHYDQKMKKSFSQKIYSLLQQVKSMKQDIITNNNRPNRQARNNMNNKTNNTNINYNNNNNNNNNNKRMYQYQDDSNFQPQPNDYNPRIKKSMSDGRFRSYGAVVGVPNPTFRRQQQKNNYHNHNLNPNPNLKDNPTQKKQQGHRLILRTLNVVPCDQYYKNQPQKQTIRSNNRQQNYRQSGSIHGNDYYQSRFN